MEIYLDKRAVKQIRLSAADAIEEGDTEALQVDIFEAFPEEQVETLEQMLADGDLMLMLGELLEEWSGDDVDELFELLETQLGDHGIDLKYFSADDGDDLDDEEDADFDAEIDAPDDDEEGTVAGIDDEEDDADDDADEDPVLDDD